MAYKVTNSLAALKCNLFQISRLIFRRNHVDHFTPLSGVKVIDLTRIVAGPYCTMILGDLGADVIKIEKTGSGDEARRWGPPFVNNTKETAYFVCLNRNKRSVCIDFKSSEGRDVLYELIKKSDVLVENYVPGKLAKLGLDYESLKKFAPHLIYCSLTGFGPTGPYKNRPGYDVIASSMGGMLHITGPENGEPCKVGVAMTDLATGLYAHGAILAALLQKNQTGHGQKIDCDLLSTQVSCLINIGSNYLTSNIEAKRHGTSHASIVPYQSFPTADGNYITVGAGSNDMFTELCSLLELPELSSSDKFNSNANRVKNRNELISILRERFKQKTLSEWLTVLESSSCPHGPVNTLAQVFNDPHVKEVGLVQELHHPTTGSIKVVGPPVKYGEKKYAAPLPPPCLGEHTDEVLQEMLGYSVERINELRKKNIVQ